MRKYLIFISCLLSVLSFSSCSPRDFLTRRLAADLLRHVAVQQVLKDFPSPRPFTTVLKGITDPVTLYRLTLPAELAGCDATPDVSRSHPPLDKRTKRS